jgi:superfamily I DNA and/or RNA helicase
MGNSQRNENELEKFKWFLENLQYARRKKRLYATCESIGRIVSLKTQGLDAKYMYAVQKKEDYDREKKTGLEILDRYGRSLLILEDPDAIDIYSDDGNKVEKLAFQEPEQSGFNGISFVRLSPKDENDDAADDGLDPFFDENSTVYINGDDKTDVRVLNKSIKEERILALNITESPDRLNLKYNTVVIERQLKAVKNLIENPQQHNAPILRIMSEGCCFPYFEPEPESSVIWKVLTDESSVGVEKQREFVRKALATDDFALMEGPPGSGKTTCITELIWQILDRDVNAKICLTASTHVAVDNVLERLEGYNLPVLRVGGQDRRSEAAEKYSAEKVTETEMNKLMAGLKERTSKAAAEFLNYLKTTEGKKEFEDFIYETTNVVCSTTNSISNYREIWETKGERDKPVPLIFEYLILDEASKTTIPEFLLPAVYSKRFIIIGDRKQLSPYVEQQDLVDNIDEIRHYEIIQQLRLNKSDERNKLFFQVVDDALLIKTNIDEAKVLESQARLVSVPESLRSDERLSNLRQYLNKMFEGDKHLLYSDMMDGDSINDPKTLAKIALSDVVTVFENDIERLTSFLPVRSKENPNYKLLGLNNRQYKTYKECSAEQAWRYNREYELRNLDAGGQRNQRHHSAATRRDEYKKEADALTLQGLKVQKDIDTAVRICNGSILECLQTGYNPNYKGPAADSIPIRTGLKDDLECRFTPLEYQYRMHPEIAKFPRKMFYGGDALKDDTEFSKSCKYFEGKAHLIWLKVVSRGRNKWMNHNPYEVNAVEKKVLEVLKDNSKPENGDKFTVAILTFYRKQEKELAAMLQGVFKTKKTRYFEKGNISLRLCTVDRFQGNEADMVIISLVRNTGVGFLDSPNRLNVALTRARQQLIVVGDHGYFLNTKNKRLYILQELAKAIKPTIPFGGEK